MINPDYKDDEVRDEVTNEVLTESNYRSKILQNERSRKTKFIAVDSQRAYFRRLQNEIMKMYSKQEENPVLYLCGVDNVSDDLVYEMAEGHEYQFEYKEKHYSASYHSYTASHNTSMGITMGSILFIRSDEIQNVKQFIQDKIITRPSREIYQYSSDMGHWRRVGVVKDRDPKTLVLKEGVYENVMDDVDDFIHSKEDYDKYGIPYKKVLLFFGEPGTGKTSLCKLLAAKTNRSLYIISFDPKMTDDGLSSAIRGIDSTCGILLLEDIDCLFKTRNTNENLSSISFSSILNSLDGAVVNEGLIVIITTNYPETLDYALRRPMRVDKIVEFPIVDEHQIQKILDLYDVNLSKQIFRRLTSLSVNHKMCPAGISGFLFRNRKKELIDENIIELFKAYLEELEIDKKEKQKQSTMLM